MVILKVLNVANVMTHLCCLYASVRVVFANVTARENARHAIFIGITTVVANFERIIIILSYNYGKYNVEIRWSCVEILKC